MGHEKFQKKTNFLFEKNSNGFEKNPEENPQKITWNGNSIERRSLQGKKVKVSENVH